MTDYIDPCDTCSMANSKTIGVTIPEDTVDALKRHAEADRRTLSNLAAWIISAWVDAKEKPDVGNEQRGGGR